MMIFLIVIMNIIRTQTQLILNAPKAGKYEDALSPLVLAG